MSFFKADISFNGRCNSAERNYGKCYARQHRLEAGIV